MTCLIVILVLIFSFRISAKEKWGVVLVDMHGKGLYFRTHRQLVHLHNISPELNIELFVHQSHDMSKCVFLNERLVVKRLDLPFKEILYEAQFNNSRTSYGYISKAYALLASQFETAIFFDSDVWHCFGWEQAVDTALTTYPHEINKVLWTDGGNFMCMRGADEIQRSKAHWDPRVEPEMDEYMNYTEANTGTIVVIRKSLISDKFLNNTIALWHMHDLHDISGTDQGAFREQSFLERHEIKPIRLNREIFCRPQGKGTIITHDGNSQCGSCALIHYAGHFDALSANLTKHTKHTCWSL